MPGITIRGLTKTFGSTVAVDDVTLSINSGDLFFLLGPSGCGKTTLLRMIAGFVEPASGSIHFGEKDVTHVAPNRRNTGMVFQSYALWPHMTVQANVAYGLNVRKVPAAARAQRVMRALQLVHMEDYAQRKPNQLSGGQQQRVALARALVIEPTVLLLDEPLSNLDAKLRLEMRTEIRRICTETKITTVYVTHDQKEALSMADNMAVLRAGKVVQIGPPAQMYRRPASKFVADFLGETNFIQAKVLSVQNEASNTIVTLETAAGILRRVDSQNATAPPPPPPGSTVTCSIRPEAMQLTRQPQSTNCLTGKRLRSTFLGEMAQHVVELKDRSILRVNENNPSSEYMKIDDVSVQIDENAIVIVAD